MNQTSNKKAMMMLQIANVWKHLKEIMHKVLNIFFGFLLFSYAISISGWQFRKTPGVAKRKAFIIAVDQIEKIMYDMFLLIWSKNCLLIKSKILQEHICRDVNITCFCKLLNLTISNYSIRSAQMISFHIWKLIICADLIE